MAGRLSPHAAILFVMAATLIMSFQDAIVKLVSTDLPLWQIFTVRSLIAIILLVALSPLVAPNTQVRLSDAKRGAVSLWPRQPVWALLRGALLVAMYVAFYAALTVLQLSVVAAAYYTGPLFITLFAGLFLGEKVGMRVIGALLLGFAGVLTILRPGTDDFAIAMLIPIASAVFYAFAMVLTRGRCRNETPLSLSVALNIAFVACGVAMTAVLAVADLPPRLVASSPFLLGPWVPMGVKTWGILGALAVMNVAIHLALARAYQIGAPPTVASFDYSYLVFAVLWGFVLLAEVPTAATLAGMAMIAAAGLIVILARQRRAGGKQTAA